MARTSATGSGHGIGLATHEAPRSAGGARRRRCRSPTVFSVEPGIYLEGETGVRIEDLVAARRRGRARRAPDPLPARGPRRRRADALGSATGVVCYDRASIHAPRPAGARVQRSRRPAGRHAQEPDPHDQHRRTAARASPSSSTASSGRSSTTTTSRWAAARPRSGSRCATSSAARRSSARSRPARSGRARRWRSGPSSSCTATATTTTSWTTTPTTSSS